MSLFENNTFFSHPEQNLSLKEQNSKVINANKVISNTTSNLRLTMEKNPSLEYRIKEWEKEGASSSTTAIPQFHEKEDLTLAEKIWCKKFEDSFKN